MNLTSFAHFNRGQLSGFRLDPGVLYALRRALFRTARVARHVVAHPFLLTLCTLAVIEVMLGLRLWTQLTGRPIDSAWLAPLVALSDPLVAPFSDFDSNPPLIEGASVFDVSTVLAMNVYLIIALAGLITGLIVSGLVRLIAASFRPDYDEAKELTIHPGS
jgi:hypothetical protein